MPSHIRTTDFVRRKPRASPCLRKSLGKRRGEEETPSCRPCPSLPGPSGHVPATTFPGARGCVSLTLSPGRDRNPFAGSSQRCWDPLAFSQRTSINTKGEQNGSNYRKYKQHENSQVSKVQVSQPQITTLEPKMLARLPAGPGPGSSPRRLACRCTSWLPWGWAARPSPRRSPPAPLRPA